MRTFLGIKAMMEKGEKEMKQIVRIAVFVLLCAIFCTTFNVAAWAEETWPYSSSDSSSETTSASANQSHTSRNLSSSTQVRFSTDDNYDLTGLVLIDESGNEIQPTNTGDEWAYLLAPGEYTYYYHDNRGIFLDIQEQQFVVEHEGLTFQLTLTPTFAENFSTETIVNPLYVDIVDETDLLPPSFTYEEEINRILTSLGVDNENGESLFLEDSSTFDASSGNANDAAIALRERMADRTQTVTVSFFTDSSMTSDLASLMSNYFVKSAFTHTGNHTEGDTIRFEFKGYSVNYTWNIPVSGISS